MADVAQRVLAADGALSVLSVGSEAPVTLETPVPLVKRCYMKLAALIHPDKIGRAFPAATEAFQSLVRAYDQFANGELAKAVAEADKAKGKKRSKKDGPKPLKQPAAASTKAVEQAATPSEAAVASEAAPSKKAPARTSKPKPAAASDSDDDDNSSDEEGGGTGVERYMPKCMADCNREESKGQTVYFTPVACPNCSTPWVPDTPKLYTLVMAYNHKSHCETCLLEYGWATAQHFCPCCKRQVDYDPRNYNRQVKCGHCARMYGYAAVPIDRKILLELAARRKLEAEAEATRRDREARMARRGGGDDDDFELKVGECMVEERCPLCRKTVRAKHRAHVEECVRKGVRPPPSRPTVVEGAPKRAPSKKKKKPAASGSRKKKESGTAGKKATRSSAAGKKTPKKSLGRKTK